MADNTTYILEFHQIVASDIVWMDDTASTQSLPARVAVSPEDVVILIDMGDSRYEVIKKAEVAVQNFLQAYFHTAIESFQMNIVSAQGKKLRKTK